MWQQRLGGQALALALALLLVALPTFGDPAGLIGVARGSGPIEINGMLFPAESNMYDGDQIRTGEQASLSLIISSEEKILLGPNSQVRIDRRGNKNILSLQRGVANFRSSGAIGVTIEEYGVQIRVRSGPPALAQVAYLAPGNSHVAALEGSLEVTTSRETYVVTEGTALRLVPQEQEPPGPKGPHKEAGLSQGEKIAILAGVITGIAVIVVPLTVGREDGQVPLSPAAP